MYWQNNAVYPFNAIINQEKMAMTVNFKPDVLHGAKSADTTLAIRYALSCDFSYN